MTLSARIKAFFSKKSSSAVAQPDNAPATPSSEPSFKQFLRKSKRTSTVSSSYAQGISDLNHDPLGWMLHISPTATLVEGQITTSPSSASPASAPTSFSTGFSVPSARKKKRPVSLLASLGSTMRSAGYAGADASAQATMAYNKRSSMPAPLVFAPVPKIPGHAHSKRSGMTPFF